MKYYVPKMLKTHIDIELLGNKQELELNWATGMIGAIPVFDSLENLKNYSLDAKYFVVEEVDK